MTTLTNADHIRGGEEVVSFADERAKRERFRLFWMPLIAFAVLLALVPFYLAAMNTHILDMAFLSSICGTFSF